MKKITPSNKILIIFPFWERDRVTLQGLSHLLADLMPSHSEDFDVLFVARFDCPQVDAATIKHVSRKFNVMTHTSRRRDVGWPGGCSGVFFGALEYVYHKMNVGQIPNYKALFICAADAVPISRDCFGYLHRQWDAIAQKKAICMAGALVPDGGREHINGDCCLLTGNLGFLKWITKTVGGMKARVGWDFGLADSFRDRGWSNIPGIRSFWGTPTSSMADAHSWARQGIIWVHGVKDESLLRNARTLLL